MTQRSVPQVSRRPKGVKVTPGSHIISDIGEVPIPDRHGNKFFVLFKDMCTQERVVYRMTTKDQLVHCYKNYVADHEYQVLEGFFFCRMKYLVTDDDVMYVKGKIEETSKL